MIRTSGLPHESGSPCARKSEYFNSASITEINRNELTLLKLIKSDERCGLLINLTQRSTAVLPCRKRKNLEDARQSSGSFPVLLATTSVLWELLERRIK